MQSTPFGKRVRVMNLASRDRPKDGSPHDSSSKPRWRLVALAVGAFLTWISLEIWIAYIVGGLPFAHGGEVSLWTLFGWISAVAAIGTTFYLAGFRAAKIIVGYIALTFITVGLAPVAVDAIIAEASLNIARNAFAQLGSAIALIAVAIAFASPFDAPARETLSLALPERRRMLSFALPTIAWVAISVLWRFTPFNPVMHPDAPDPVTAIHAALGNTTMLTLAYLAVLVPIGEEILFRGFFTNIMRRAASNVGIAAVASAVLFALLHPPLGYFSVNHVLFIFALGLVLAVTLIVTRSIWPGVALHAANNAAVTLQSISA